MEVQIQIINSFQVQKLAFLPCGGGRETSRNECMERAGRVNSKLSRLHGSAMLSVVSAHYACHAARKATAASNDHDCVGSQSQQLPGKLFPRMYTQIRVECRLGKALTQLHLAWQCPGTACASGEADCILCRRVFRMKCVDSVVL